MTARSSRRFKAAMLAPLVLTLAACADKAPLDTLNPKGPEARAIDQLSDPVFAVAGVVFLLVQFGVLYLAIKFRKRKDDDDSLPPQVHGNFKLEIGWTILPALVLAAVGAGSVFTILDLADTPKDAQEITVIGQQWWWEYRYDVDHDGKDDIVTANDLVIPAGEPIALTITSRDVIHSFWIPALNGKRDAVPGRDAGIDALLEGLVAEVRAPGPAGHEGLDRTLERHHAGRTVAAEDHRSDVAGLDPVASHRLPMRVGQLCRGPGRIHAVDLA